MKYLPVNVYRASGRDCTNRGVTSTDQIRLVVPLEDGFLTLEDLDKSDEPTVILEPGSILGCPNFTPQHAHTSSPMFGGNFVWSSDSRFRRTYGDQPIAVHDRFE